MVDYKLKIYIYIKVFFINYVSFIICAISLRIIYAIPKRKIKNIT